MRVRLHRVGEAHPRGQHRAQSGELLRRGLAGVGKAGRAVGLGQGAALGIVKSEKHKNL